MRKKDKKFANSTHENFENFVLDDEEETRINRENVTLRIRKCLKLQTCVNSCQENAEVANFWGKIISVSLNRANLLVLTNCWFPAIWIRYFSMNVVSTLQNFWCTCPTSFDVCSKVFRNYFRNFESLLSKWRENEVTKIKIQNSCWVNIHISYFYLSCSCSFAHLLVQLTSHLSSCLILKIQNFLLSSSVCQKFRKFYN